jgi:hypothetical protein
MASRSSTTMRLKKKKASSLTSATTTKTSPVGYTSPSSLSNYDNPRFIFDLVYTADFVRSKGFN